MKIQDCWLPLVFELHLPVSVIENEHSWHQEYYGSQSKLTLLKKFLRAGCGPGEASRNMFPCARNAGRIQKNLGTGRQGWLAIKKGTERSSNNQNFIFQKGLLPTAGQILRISRRQGCLAKKKSTVEAEEGSERLGHPPNHHPPGIIVTLSFMGTANLPIWTEVGELFFEVLY